MGEGVQFREYLKKKKKEKVKKNVREIERENIEIKKSRKSLVKNTR